MADKFAY